MRNPFASICGVTLEQYAELAAQMRGADGDLEACAAIAEGAGISRERWNAARNGWNARMIDPRTAGAVATAYVELYRQVVDRERLQPSTGATVDHEDSHAPANHPAVRSE